LTYPVNIPAQNKWLLWLTASFFFLLFAIAPLSAQERNELEQQRQRLIKEIKETELALQETKENKAVTLDQYLTLQSQIQKRKALIGTLKEEIDAADVAIDEANQQLQQLNTELNRLKEEYANTIRKAYQLKLNNSFMAFLFSADNFNDAYRRWQYLRQYDSSRKRQAQEIIATQNQLMERSERLAVQKTEKEQLLLSHQKQNSLLSGELSDKNKILKALNTSESQLITALNEQQEAHDALNNAIEKIIRNEMAKRARSSRSASGSNEPSSSSNLNDTPESDAPLSSNFSKNKGKLPWPVKKGYITRKFGKQPHPQVRSIQITNNGIDITTDAKAKVYPIFDGEVAGTQFIPGYLNTVIVKHGNYYTAYSNLDQIYVKRGDKVSPDKSIGIVGTKKPEVHFEIWLGKKRLNPSKWVAKK
jgi:septal ring factor EnvC (AmiA/AmiB activator)